MNITDAMLYEHAAEARDIWLDTLPADEEIPQHHFSNRFERKMKKLLKEQRHSLRTGQVLRYIRRTVAVAMVMLVVVLSGLMTVKAYREKVIEIIVQVFNDLTDYRFSSNQTEDDLPAITFGYIPDGMTESNTESYDGYYYVLYEDLDGNFFEFTQSVILPDDDYQKILDTEGATTEYFYIAGEEAVANSKNGDSTVIWSRQNALYHLFGNISLEDLKEIALQIN